jgi:predicted esterase
MPARLNPCRPLSLAIVHRRLFFLLLLLAASLPAVAADTRDVFELNGHEAFLYAARTPAAGKPWLWYAPTLKGISLAGRKMYFDAFQQSGIAIAGYDLGEVRGSPASTAAFTALYDEMVRRGYSARPILLGQSRGGMMMLRWAVTNPDKVRAFVGIYPVCNLASWPLKNSKRETLADFGLPETELVEKLAQFNPIDHLQGLLATKVPMFIVHGDSDVVVPYDENSRLVKERYEAGGGTITVKLIPGEGHKVSPSFFECRELVNFVLKVASER